MKRRKFLKLLAGAAVGTGLYGAIEARRLQVTRLSVRIPNLPAAFSGATIALLADFHRSLFTPESTLRHAVAATNALAPDYVVLGGDYITAGPKYGFYGCGLRYLEPCFSVLSGLRARSGIFAVTGNHDTHAGLQFVNEAIARAGFVNLSNAGVWLERDGVRLRLCGVGDLRTQQQHLGPALADSTSKDAVILATHHPDYGELLRDPRVSLVLSGHTHGGQVVIPHLGAPLVPSDYHQKYRYGLVRAPATQVYVTSGVGVLPIAVRLNCMPEIALLTLQPV